MRSRLRRYYLYYLGRVAAFLVYILPLNVGLYAASVLGKAAFFVLSRYRKIALDNLRSVFGAEKTQGEIEEIAAAVFQNLAKNAVELINFPKITSSNIDTLVTIENSGVLARALEKGKGVVLVTGHFGNWELMASTLRLKGYYGAAIGRRIYFDRYDAFLNTLRRLHSVNIIYRDSSPKKVLRVLKNNGIIGILADQDVDSVDGVYVNFLGRPAYTPVGPVALAKASGASLVPAFMVRNNGRHALVIEEPIELVDTGDKERDLIVNTQRWSDRLESYIRKYPEWWVWIHRRWKTQPK